jgi:uncharacterized membrane protein
VDERRVLAPAGDLGESPLLPAAALVAAAALYADMPSRFIVGPGGGAFSVVRWVVPALTVFVLVTFVVIRPRGRLVEAFGWGERSLHLTRRRLALMSIGFVSLANSVSIILLVHLLVNGELTNKTTAAAELLRAAVHMWVVNVLLFGLWYWQLDGGGPVNRQTCAPHQRDFLFPQNTEPALEESGWHPEFLDYLYLSFTNAAAFSPTDTMPLSRWAKMLMLVQSAISLALAVMVVARAVNILR